MSVPKNKPLRKLRSTLLCLLLAAAMAFFFTDPVRYAGCVFDGVSLWAVNVLPATFPFLFLTALLTGLPAFGALSRKLSAPFGKLFKVSGAGGGVAILAALSGYPVGARMVYDLSSAGRLAKEERFRVACLATTSGPMFLVGTVGSILYRSSAAGWVLLLSHLAAVWLVCLAMRPKRRPQTQPLPPFVKAPALLYDSLYNSVISILCVGGAIALFSCFGQMLEDTGIVKLLSGAMGETYAKGLVRGLLEMTTGCAVLARECTPLSLALSCALVTFGGVCVLCQQAAFLVRAEVPMLPFLGVKTLQALLAFGVCLGLGAALL